MSITFWCPKAPTTVVDCEFCGPGGSFHDRIDSAGHSLLNEDGRCDDHCDGTEEVSTAPECNFANANAAAVLDILPQLAVHGDYTYGEVKPKHMPDVLQQLMLLLNSPRRRESATRAAASGGGNGTARWMDAGTDDVAVQRRLLALQQLLIWAVEHNMSVHWG